MKHILILLLVSQALTPSVLAKSDSTLQSGYDSLCLNINDWRYVVKGLEYAKEADSMWALCERYSEVLEDEVDLLKNEIESWKAELRLADEQIATYEQKVNDYEAQNSQLWKQVKRQRLKGWLGTSLTMVVSGISIYLMAK